MNAEEEIQLLRAHVSELETEVASLRKTVKDREDGWDRCWNNYKEIIDLSIDMMDSCEIVVEFEKGIMVKFDLELFETFEDQIAQIADRPVLSEHDDEPTKDRRMNQQ